MKKQLLVFVFMIIPLCLSAEVVLSNKSAQPVQNTDAVSDQTATSGVQSGPEIDIPNAVVFKIDKFRADDYVIFKNLTSQVELSCNVYFYNERNHKWIHSYEDAVLGGYGDTDRIEVVDDQGIEDIVYLAVEIVPEGDYNFHLYAKRDDLYIEISD